MKNSFIHTFYLKWIGRIFEDEYGLADVSSDETVLHIGCGILPTMSILVSKNAHAKVIAIDNDAAVIRYARQYIDEQRLNESIRVELGDGRTYPAASFDVIIIAINVTPIDQVFRHLAESSKQNVRIICRDVGDGVIQMLMNDEFSKIFSIKSVMNHSIIHSLLILKNRELRATT